VRHHNSPANRTRELFKSLKDVVSLLVCNAEVFTTPITSENWKLVAILVTQALCCALIKNVASRARPISFSVLIPMLFNSQCWYWYFCIAQAVSILPYEALFCLMRQNNHSWSYFAFGQTFLNYSWWKTLQCIFFFRPHKQRK